MADEDAGQAEPMSIDVNSFAVESLIEPAAVESNPETCCICWEPIDVTSRAVLVPCGHRYHKACIDQWFTTSNARNCSYCRTAAVQTQFGFQADGTFRTDPARVNATARDPRSGPVSRQIRRNFLMCIITPRVYLYTLAIESSFTIYNSSDRIIELVNDDSQVMFTLLSGDHSGNIFLNYNLRFQDEPQVEFTLFDLDNFFHGSVIVTANTSAARVGELLRQELINIENARNERLLANEVANENHIDEDPETPRMRRRRERSERIPRPRRGRRARRGM